MWEYLKSWIWDVAEETEEMDDTADDVMAQAATLIKKLEAENAAALEDIAEEMKKHDAVSVAVSRSLVPEADDFELEEELEALVGGAGRGVTATFAYDRYVAVGSSPKSIIEVDEDAVLEAELEALMEKESMGTMAVKVMR
ncbi:MAG: hypothetical protein HOI53_05155 [Francisellaceae bacterium]|jgi:hypothetical protein|nr:hypothetical protein [Francisellaceae bacterium]MBT6207393.1 hypothetical protein [Francisellaceae bacterium]MBT6539220.1 hypothetical protein [Francisellaceae bacterium]